jgi:4-amino-4-deoxy-L-arabinose transferase-like glycosyltransferase
MDPLPASPVAVAVTRDAAAPATLRTTSLLIILLLWLLIYLAGMFSPALLDDADTVHAEAAREMVLRHDWVTLHVNGIRYMEKAPLLYWGVASSYRIFGVSEWSTRLPLMLGVLALLITVYKLGSYAYGEKAGFYSAIVLSTSLGPYIFTRFLIPDILVGLWLALTFYLFLRTLDSNPPSRFDCWGIAAVCGLDVLTKGLIGLVFPVGVIVGYLLLTGNLRHLLRLRLVSSFVVFLVVAAPWHILASLHNPDQGNIRGFLWFYFVNEHFLRFLNKRVPRDYDTVPLLLFWFLYILWAFPWSAFLPQAVTKIGLHWRAFREKMGRAQSASLIFFLWAVIIVLFFSFSTRQEYYTVPSVPALALLIGHCLWRESESPATSPERRAGTLSSAVLLVIGVLAFVCGAFFLLYSKAPPPGTDLSELLTKNPADYALSFGHFLDLTPQSLGAFRGPLLGFSFALLMGTFCNWWFRRRGDAARGNTALVAMMVVVLACVHSGYVIFSPILTSKPLALAIKQHYRPGDIVVVGGEWDAASSLNFYTDAHLLVLHEPVSNLWYGSQFPDAPPVWLTPETFEPLWSGSRRVFFWSDNPHPEALRSAPGFELARSGGKYLFSNRPST